MKNPKLKPGDCLHIINVGSRVNIRCVGCVLRVAKNSRIEEEISRLEIVRPSDQRCILYFDNARCRVEYGDEFELLTPEEVMEIKLCQ